MITQIKGRLIEKSPTELVIDCNGVGYSINISLNTYSQIGDDENIKLFTIGFGKSIAAETSKLLTKCSTDGENYLRAYDSAALSASFSDIAARISQLYLSR